MRIILTIIICLISTTVFANEKFNLSAGAWSEHITSSDISNESHRLIAVQKDSFFGGYFKNSHGNDTVFIGYYSEFKLTKNVESFVSLGVMYGYTTCYGEDNSSKNVCPLGTVGVSYTKYRVEPTVYLLGDAIAIGPRIKF